VSQKLRLGRQHDRYVEEKALYLERSHRDTFLRPEARAADEHCISSWRLLAYVISRSRGAGAGFAPTCRARPSLARCKRSAGP
jgi:hypothetical protein